MNTLRFTLKAGALLATMTALAIIAAACSGGGEETGFSDNSSPTAGTDTAITALVVNSEIVVGENRFMVGLIGSDNKEIIGADVAFHFFKLDGDQQELRLEAQATPIAIEKTFTQTHEDGTVETHSAGETGVYVATVQFDEAGTWAVEATASIGGTTHDPVVAAFSVLEESATPAVGAPAPRSETLTLDDVTDVSEIDTSDPAIPGMHTMTIAEAVTSGRPSVIVFATPAFCVSRICGPTKEAVDELFEEYEGQANFVHIEPYDIEKARGGEGLDPIPATEEWGLVSEPWVFLVDADGNVAAKFEAVVTLDELEEALTPLLVGGAAGTRD